MASQFLDKTAKRSRLVEMGAVAAIVSIVIAVGFSYMRKPADQSQRKVLEFQASTFERMVNNIHAIGAAKPDHIVGLGEATFYLNEQGWPANTSHAKSPSIVNQSVQECMELWEGVFDNSGRNSLENFPYKQKIEVLAEVKQKVICRYFLSTKQEVAYFFDYDLRSGAVSVVRTITPRDSATPSL